MNPEDARLTLTITLGPRGTHTRIHSQAEGLVPNEVRQWLERAIIALGAERDALANCRLHGELTMEGFDERCAADDVELAAALSAMRRTARGWRKKALDGAHHAVAQDQEARRIVHEAARHLRQGSESSEGGVG